MYKYGNFIEDNNFQAIPLMIFTVERIYCEKGMKAPFSIC